jgi:hypothetical protein
LPFAERIDEFCNTMISSFSEVVKRAGESEDVNYDASAQNELAMMQAGGAFVCSTSPLTPPYVPSVSGTASAMSSVDHSRGQRLMDLQKGAVQDTSTLIRELQELWLFGGLDTITDPADDAANKEKALELAALIEKLAKSKIPSGQKGEER